MSFDSIRRLDIAGGRGERRELRGAEDAKNGGKGDRLITQSAVREDLKKTALPKYTDRYRKGEERKANAPEVITGRLDEK